MGGKAKPDVVNIIVFLIIYNGKQRTLYIKLKITEKKTFILYFFIFKIKRN